ncbi:MAG: hypothetical protein KIS68_14600 [Bauldia sp.]|nr:hypothetical protein [Bauldia sp.]
MKSPTIAGRALRFGPWLGIFGAVAVAAIGIGGSVSGQTPEPVADRSALTGAELFNLPFPGAGNQRSCASCHVAADSFALTADHAERLWQENPLDPLFSAIDADDPAAATLTFDHLRKGLVRVWLTLPENMDQIDAAGNVITPDDRRIFVWRSVPSIADAALTAPYQLDGRVATLAEQAQAAILSHSEGLAVPADELARIAGFVAQVFTSERSRAVAALLTGGTPMTDIPEPEAGLVLTVEEQRGREVYEAVCAACHGGANLTTIIDREIHDMAFPALGVDGNVIYQVPATDPPTPVRASQPNNEFINIGTAIENFLVQIDATEHESFTGDLSFPQYRFRFYQDATRTVAIADLPPAPAFPIDLLFGGDEGGPSGPGGGESGFGGDGLPAFNDENGNPINGPNFFALQLFTTDPGRAAITGNPYDFEAFDIPTLRGIANTAPYWHNNISATLEAVIDLYSDHLLVKFPPLVLEGVKQVDRDGDIGPVGEALTEQQKTDLLAYLRRL